MYLLSNSCVDIFSDLLYFVGIRVKSYDKLWEGCKSKKAKIESMLNLLKERGLKGNPTIKECRRLKKMFERKQEVAELNTSNIITTTGNFKFY